MNFSSKDFLPFLNSNKPLSPLSYTNNPSPAQIYPFPFLNTFACQINPSDFQIKPSSLYMNSII